MRMPRGMLRGMGSKSSVYLTDEMAARWRATGLPLSEILRRGLDAGEPPAIEVIVRRVIREELAEAGSPRERAGPPDCPHPKARVHKGLCGACGTHAGGKAS